jgi:transposase
LLDISEFGSNLKDFRDYCKNEFRNVFGQNVKINYDLMEKVFGNISDEIIMQKFDVIFGLCNK